MMRLLVTFWTVALIGFCQAQQQAEVTDQVYMDLTIGGEDAGRLVIGLYGGVVPQTVANFKTICTNGLKAYNGRGYTGSMFHRIIKNFMMQGGDFINGDGTGSASIYGRKFPDESFAIKHTGAGDLSMANSGPNTNGCQFFITFKQTTWLDGKHVVFGKVIQGLDLLNYIHENVRTDKSDKPLSPVVIKQCGAL